MYDSEYFKKVIGNNYNSKEIYNTPKNDNENNIFPVNVDNPKTRYEANGNISYNNSPYPEDYNISNYQNSNTYPKEYQETQNTNAQYQTTQNTNAQYQTTQNADAQYQTIQNTNAQYQEAQNINAPYQEAQDINTEYQQSQNTNAIYQEIANTSTEYPEIYNIVEPMVEELLSKNQDMEFTNGVVDTMAMEIYNALESDTNQTSTPANSNGIYIEGSVVNTNSRPRHRNSLLQDLIKILLLNHINRPRPPRPHPDRPTPCPPYQPRQNY